MEDGLRILKTVKNLAYTWCGYFAVVLCTFAGRTFFVKTIGTAYLGVGGLFSSMLSCLNLADLGLSAAITYSLYRPLAERDEGKITAILMLFRKAYITVGVVVGVAGLLLAPFLEFFVSDVPEHIPYSDLRLYYILFVVNNALHYFLYYKSVLFHADQRQYVVELNYSASMVAMTVAQMAVLAVTGNYTLYLVVQVVFTVWRNVSISVIADRKYPYIKRPASCRLSRQDKAGLLKGIGGRMFQKVGTAVVNSTDNIIISKFISISTVGLYANYSSITSTASMLLGQVFQSALASVGNFNITAGRGAMADVFRKSLFINFWLHGLSGICLACLLDPLVQAWLGEEYMLPQGIAAILGVNFYLNGMRQTSLMFGDALGLYWENRYKPVFEALVNLAMSLILARPLGLAGVFLGTTCSIVFVCMWAEPYIIFRHALHLPLWVYFKDYLRYSMVAASAGFCTCFLCGRILYGGVLGLFVKAAVCAVVPNACFFVAFRKDGAFRFYSHFLWEFVKERMR